MVIVQYSHTEDVDDDDLVADVLTKPLSQVKSSNTFETIFVWFEKTFPERGSNDVAVGLYHPWVLALKRYGDLSP